MTLLELYEKFNDYGITANLDNSEDRAFAYKLCADEFLSFARKKCEYLIYRKKEYDFNYLDSVYDVLKQKSDALDEGDVPDEIEYRFIEYWPLARIEMDRKEWLNSLKVKK